MQEIISNFIKLNVKIYVKQTTLEELKILKYIIYYIRNKINGKGYIGQTIQSFHKRYGKIWYKAHRDNYFSRALKFHGQENFEVFILENSIFDRRELNRLEKYYINFYKTRDRKYGYNLREGGDRYYIHTQNILEKLALARKKNNIEYPYRILDKNGNNLNRGNLTEVLLRKRKHTKGFHLP